jgi:VIT1/CCC1 family predicted Fe2+/Mn2+ transporter
MAAGEYVSVSSQRDYEKADIAIEKKSINENPEKELAELTWIYEQRGLEPKLAKQVALQLHKKDAVGAHARDELSIDYEDLANPSQAVISLIGLAISGAIGAYIGGGNRIVASLRVFVGGGIAMAITFFVGSLIGGGI